MPFNLIVVSYSSFSLHHHPVLTGITEMTSVLIFRQLCVVLTNILVHFKFHRQRQTLHRVTTSYV